MSYQDEPLFDEQSTCFILEVEQNKLQAQLSKTTSSNKKTYLDNLSRYVNVVGDDKIETKLENYSSIKINNPFIENNINALGINSPIELEDVLNFDNLPNFIYDRLNDSIVIEIPLRAQNQNNPENVGSSVYEERRNSFLNRKRESDGFKIKFKRKDNGKKGVARLFFNHYLRKLIFKMEEDCKCILFLDFFPEKFIFSTYTKNNKFYLDYTFEQLLENKDLYKDKDPFNNYAINKKVIDELKSKKYKEIMTANGHYKTLQKTYRNLFEDFLHSKEFKNHCDDLLEKKGELEVEKFKYCANKFI